MKPKTMILMVVAVVCGLGASYMTSRLLAERDDKPAEPVAIPKVKLLVAKKNLDMHMAFGKKPEDLFTSRDFIKDDVPKDALLPEDVAKLKGKYLKRTLRKNDHLTMDDIMDNNPGLKYLPPGYRAVGIQVTGGQSASGFACVPGSHVDIIWTGREGNGSGTVGRLFLRDVIVLAADTAATASENGGAMVASVVTVALTPEDSVRIAQAMDTGTLRLVLRNLDEKDDVKTVAQQDPPRKELVADPIITPPDQGNPPKKNELPPGVRKITVVAINGDKVDQYHYWLDANNNIIAEPQFDQGDLPPAAPEKKK
jgi:pilus assembly protein CpaB